LSQPIYLLDTSVILPLVRGNALGRYIDQRFCLRSATQRPLVSVVSLGEVRVLAARNGWAEAKLRALSNALDNLIVVDIHHPSVIDATWSLISLRNAIPTAPATWARTICGSQPVPKPRERRC
jgi:predicted nucleic acid-binding protein